VIRVAEKGFFLAQGGLNHNGSLRQGRKDEYDRRLEPTEVYFFLPDLMMDGLHLQIGRQDLEESREWLFDERVDGVRLYYDQLPVKFEVSASRMPQFLNRAPPPQSSTFHAAATLPITDRWQLSSYVIDRRTHDLDDFSPFHYGVRSFSKPDIGLAHWLELSRADGIAANRRLQGHAIDAGITWVAEHTLEPSLTD
jgi:alginate production protein